MVLSKESVVVVVRGVGCYWRRERRIVKLGQRKAAQVSEAGLGCC